MSLRRDTPCDLDGVCPYESENWGSCEYWCGSEEPQDEPDEWFYDDDEPHEGFSFPQDNPPIPEGEPAVWREWEKPEFQ